MSTIKEGLIALKGEVAELKTVGQSAVALIEGLSKKLDDAVSAYGDDPEALKTELQNISAGLNEAKQELADAVSENTTPETPAPVQDAAVENTDVAASKPADETDEA